MIVSKFGGACCTNVEYVKHIKKLSKNKKRKVFVFSAIGKVNSKDIKLTDVLIDICNNINSFYEFENKIKYLCKITNIEINIKYYINKFKNEFKKNKNNDYLISRGEYITALIMSKYLNIKFIPAENIIYFKENKINYKNIQNKLKYYINKYNQIIIPGFYGVDENKKVVLFSRGGSDITGAIISKSYCFNIYENWTDVDGIKQVNPAIIKNTEQIKKISYTDVLVMTTCDANVLHKEVGTILQNTNIITKIKNIKNPKCLPTVIDKHNHRCQFICYKQTGDYVQLVLKIKSLDNIKKHYELINYLTNKYVYICCDKNNYINIIKQLYKALKK